MLTVQKIQDFQVRGTAEILEKIKKNESIICLSHINPSGILCTDAIGSSRRLAQFIKDNFPEKKVFVDGVKSADGSHFLENIYKNDHQPTQKDYQNSLVIITDTSQSNLVDSEHWNLAKEKIKENKNRWSWDKRKICWLRVVRYTI